MTATHTVQQCEKLRAQCKDRYDRLSELVPSVREAVIFLRGMLGLDHEDLISCNFSYTGIGHVCFSEGSVPSVASLCSRMCHGWKNVNVKTRQGPFRDPIDNAHEALLQGITGLRDNERDFRTILRLAKKWEDGPDALYDRARRALKAAIERLRDFEEDDASVMRVLRDLAHRCWSDTTTKVMFARDNVDALLVHGGMIDRFLEEQGEDVSSYYTKRSEIIDLIDKRFKNLIKLIDGYMVTMDKVEPEAPQGAPFGRFLFAPERKMSDFALTVKDREVIVEPNTPIEDKVRDALAHHYEYDHLSAKYGKFLWNLARKGYYAKFLRLSEDTKSVFRGIDVNKSAIAALIKRDVKKASKQVKEKHSSFGAQRLVGNVEGNFLYKPRKLGGCSSWSIRENVAHHFGNMIMTADPYFGNNKFIIDPLTFEKSFDIPVSSEHETISVGNVRVYNVRWSLSSYMQEAPAREDPTDDDVDGPIVIASDDEGELVAL